MLLVHLWWWFQNATGISAPGSHTYNFWSGFGSDLGEVVLIGGLFSWLHHHNCKEKGCPRIGRHEVKGTPYKTCHIHATNKVHKRIHKTHSINHPEQHKFFN